MQDRRSRRPELPDHPELRELAVAMEDAGVSGDIMDSHWLTVFISSELARLAGVPPNEVTRFYGKSMITRNLEDREVWGVTDESSVGWWRQIVPIMRHYVGPADEHFEAVFRGRTDAALRVEPVDAPPRAWQQTISFVPGHAFRSSVFEDLSFVEWRISDDSGDFIGVARLVRPTLPDSLLSRLGRGDHPERRARRSRRPGPSAKVPRISAPINLTSS